MQWKEDTTAGSRMSTDRSAYGIRTQFYENGLAILSILFLHHAVAQDSSFMSIKHIGEIPTRLPSKYRWGIIFFPIFD